MIWISPEAVADKKPCWSTTHIYAYANERGFLGGVDAMTAIRDPELATIEKMWITLHFEVFTHEKMHRLAVEFARHVLPDVKGAYQSQLALAAKDQWVNGLIDDADLEMWENEAWLEARYIPECRAAAFACKRDPQTAFAGSVSRSSGMFGQNINVSERQWQRERLMEELDELQRLGRGGDGEQVEPGGSGLWPGERQEGEVGEVGDSDPEGEDSDDKLPRNGTPDTEGESEGSGPNEGVEAVLNVGSLQDHLGTALNAFDQTAKEWVEKNRGALRYGGELDNFDEYEGVLDD